MVNPIGNLLVPKNSLPIFIWTRLAGILVDIVYDSFLLCVCHGEFSYDHEVMLPFLMRALGVPFPKMYSA